MPYGSAVGSYGFGAYRIVVQHTNGTEIEVIKQAGISFGETEQDEAMQDVLDLISSSADLTVTFAQKTDPTAQEITPTP